MPVRPLADPDLPGLSTWTNEKNRFFCVRLHYTADPDKRGEAWKVRAKTGTPEVDWMQEMEINFETQRGARVFKQYDETTHRRALQPDPKRLFLRGWDFGYRRPCCLVTQIDLWDRWLLLQEFLGHDEPLELFVRRILPFMPKGSYKDFCDPAGTQKKDTDTKSRSSIDILRAFGIRPQFRKSNAADRAKIIRSKLLVRKDGSPGILVNRSCTILHEGFSGGYHFPEVPIPGREDEPEKDGFYEHPFDTLGYIAINIFKYRTDPRNRQSRPRPRPSRDYNEFTGT